MTDQEYLQMRLDEGVPVVACRPRRPLVQLGRWLQLLFGHESAALTAARNGAEQAQRRAWQRRRRCHNLTPARRGAASGSVHESTDRNLPAVSA